MRNTSGSGWSAGRGGMDFKFAKAPRESDMLFAVQRLIAEKTTLYCNNAA